MWTNNKRFLLKYEDQNESFHRLRMNLPGCALYLLPFYFQMIPCSQRDALNRWELYANFVVYLERLYRNGSYQILSKLILFKMSSNFERKRKKGDIYTSVIREFEKNYEILYSYYLSITVILSEYRIQGFKKS